MGVEEGVAVIRWATHLKYAEVIASHHMLKYQDIHILNRLYKTSINFLSLFSYVQKYLNISPKLVRIDTNRFFFLIIKKKNNSQRLEAFYEENRSKVHGWVNVGLGEEATRRGKGCPSGNWEQQRGTSLVAKCPQLAGMGVGWGDWGKTSTQFQGGLRQLWQGVGDEGTCTRAFSPAC